MMRLCSRRADAAELDVDYYAVLFVGPDLYTVSSPILPRRSERATLRQRGRVDTRLF
jgi:hypothetical protein